MSKYLVSYDLRRPGQHYGPLWLRLQQHRAERVLESLWLVRSTLTSVQLRTDLMQYLDGNDGLCIAEITENWATIGTQHNNLAA